MATLEKVLDRWRRQPPDARLDEVLSVLKHFGFVIEFKSGSHMIASHPALINKAGFGAQGSLTFPGKGGKRVKGFYLVRILRAIEIIQEAEK